MLQGSQEQSAAHFPTGSLSTFGHLSTKGMIMKRIPKFRGLINAFAFGLQLERLCKDSQATQRNPGLVFSAMLEGDTSSDAVC